MKYSSWNVFLEIEIFLVCKFKTLYPFLSKEYLRNTHDKTLGSNLIQWVGKVKTKHKHSKFFRWEYAGLVWNKISLRDFLFECSEWKSVDKMDSC